ncbi:MAG: helix-turn-helix domain-containing protein [Acutalibacteraceae bacterium]
MVDMYSKIEQLCKENNTNITAMCRLLDISRSTLSELKAGRTKTLSAEYTTKIASYFQVSVDYLLGKSQQKNTPTVSAQELSFDDFTYAMYDEGKKLSEENKAKCWKWLSFLYSSRKRKTKESEIKYENVV